MTTDNFASQLADPNEQFIQPSNYCAHAIEDLRERANTLRVTGYVGFAQGLEAVIDLLTVAVKFMLPNRAELLDRDGMGDTHLELLRLPFQVVAFEAPWITDVISEMNGYELSTSTRRIALCWELKDGFEPFEGCNRVLDENPEGGVFVLPVYYVDKERGWSVAAGGTFIPREFRVSEDFVSPEWAQLAESAVRQAGPVPKTPYRFLSTTFLALPEMFQAMLASARGDLTRATAQLQLDSRDEVMMVTQACCVLNCANVETRDFLPNPRLNAARLAKGKQPFFTYKVLQLEDTTPAKSVSAGGTHAAPRAHLRRGHIRHLASGRDVWVRNTLVNAGTSAGVVVKDYRLSPPDDGKAPL